MTNELTSNNQNANSIQLNDMNLNGVDLNLVVKQFQDVKKTLETMGIESATFNTGMTYKQDENCTVLAKSGLMVLEGKNFTQVTILHENSTPEDAIRELNQQSINQKELGSFVGRSQSWVSNILENE